MLRTDASVKIVAGSKEPSRKLCLVLGDASSADGFMSLGGKPGEALFERRRETRPAKGLGLAAA